MRVLPAIIIAVGLVLAPAVWFGLRALLVEDDFQGSTVDQGARLEIEMLHQQIENLQDRLDSLENAIARLPYEQGRAQVVPDADAEDEILRGTGPNNIIDAYAQVVNVAGRRQINRQHKVAARSYLIDKLGLPSNNLGTNCGPMENERLRSILVREQVGPVLVTMVRPAVESLRRIFANIQRADPDLYDRINTAGALCVRLIRGSASAPSTHAFGMAIDLNIDGYLDTLGDGKTQLGLTILADFFHDEGWVWGASFGREDSMHFEVGRILFDKWLAEGEFGADLSQ